MMMVPYTVQRAQQVPNSFGEISCAPHQLQTWSSCFLELPVAKVRYCKVLRSAFPEVSTSCRCTTSQEDMS